MYVMHLKSTCNQNKSKESIFVEQRDEKEVPTKSYGRGNGIFPPSPTPLWFLAQTEEWGKMQTFSEQPSVQTFAETTSSRMPVPYLGLKHAYLLKFQNLSTHVYEVPEPLFTRILTF